MCKVTYMLILMSYHMGSSHTEIISPSFIFLNMKHEIMLQRIVKKCLNKENTCVHFIWIV